MGNYLPATMKVIKSRNNCAFFNQDFSSNANSNNAVNLKLANL